MALAWKRAAKLYFEQYREAMRLKHHHQQARYEAETRAATAERQIQRLRMYVQHHGGCSWKYPDLRCTCGLAVLLAATAPNQNCK